MRKTYVIGDIHGLLGRLHDLVTRCERDADGAPAAFIFLGDYIDRGPDSRGVIDYLMDLETRKSGNMIALMGNHEALALAAIDGSMDVGVWLREGGDKTLASYGVARAHELPQKHVAWMRALRLSYDDGKRLFVHAGVNPEKPLDQQDDDDLLWIREPFLSDARNYGRLIVHGHTPTKSGLPDLRINRLNMDTGAVYGRGLSAAVFVDGETRPIAFLRADE
jgi:serine/threonine protein phosphatase 1